MGFAFGLCVLTACASKEAAAPGLDEPLEAGAVRAGVVSRESELIGGPTARGRLGDFKIYNDRIAAIIARPGSARGLHPYGGVILDADRVRPAGVKGESAFGEVIHGLDVKVLRADRIEVVSDGRGGREARVRVIGEGDTMPLFDAFIGDLFPESGGALEWMVDYVLEPGSDALRVEHHLFNPGREAIEIGLQLAGFITSKELRTFAPGFGFGTPSDGKSDYYAAVGDEISYIYGRPDAAIRSIISQDGMAFSQLGESITLRARERIVATYHLIVGDGDLARTQAIWGKLIGAGERVSMSGVVADASGRPVKGARVHVLSLDATPERDYVTQSRTDLNGAFSAAVPDGRFMLLASTSAYRVSRPTETVIAGQPAGGLDLVLSTTGRLEFRVTDEDARDLPVKVGIQAVGRATELLPSRYGEPVQYYGLLHTEFAHAGRGEIELPSGDYRLLISRGGEYEVIDEIVSIRAGEVTRVDRELVRSVVTSSWMTSDTHVHAQLSNDSGDTFRLKARALAADNVELPVSTDHDAIGDFNPAIRELGLSRWVKGIVGTEVTTSRYGHFNAFPLEQDLEQPGNGRIEWYGRSPAEIFGLLRARPSAPFIQVNHPHKTSSGYFRAMGLDAATARATSPEFSLDFDGFEVFNGCRDGTMDSAEVLDWFGFLNRGLRKVATGSSDDHVALQGELGFPVTYVKMPVDDPEQAEIEDFLESFMRGRLIVSCGPFVDFRAMGRGIGEVVRVEGGRLSIDAEVKAPTWMDVDEIRVLVNGAVAKTVTLEARRDPIRFQRAIEIAVPEGRDSWIVLWVSGDERHGLWARNRPSFAFTNPIYIDGDTNDRWEMP